MARQSKSRQSAQKAHATQKSDLKDAQPADDRNGGMGSPMATAAELLQQISLLHESRPAVRVAALKRLTLAMRRWEGLPGTEAVKSDKEKEADADDIDSWLEGAVATVAGGCEALLRLRKDAERRVAVDAAALVAAVVAGLESDGLDGEALARALWETAAVDSPGSLGPEAAEAALLAAAFVCVVSDVADETYSAIVQGAAAAFGGWLSSAAMEAWSLLLVAPGRSRGVRSPDAVAACTALCHELATADDLDTRIQAAESLALAYELFGTRDSAELKAVWAQAAGILEGLVKSTESVKRTKRAERKKQRDSLAAAIDTFAGGMAPTQSVGVGKMRLNVDGWAGAVLLQAFRRTLGAGFEVHMRRNALLADVFDFDGQGIVLDMSRQAKRARKAAFFDKSSPGVKQRMNKRLRERDNAHTRAQPEFFN